MLKVKNLTKKFDITLAVDRVSFDLKSGEIFSLIGPNGSGKTTIIKAIAGLLKPTDGEILIDGHDIVKDPVGAKAITGYIPDEPSVWPAMSGREFLNISGALYNLEERKRDERIPELLKIFDLSGIENNYFEDYSRGNKQKFTILAALLHEPKLLLIDEPIVGLDPVSAEVAKKLFSDFADKGGSVLLVTHTLSVAEEIANRIGMLKNGKLVKTGTLTELQKMAKLGEEASLGAIYKSLA